MVASLTFSLLAAAGGSPVSADAVRASGSHHRLPNVVVILTDDQRRGAVSTMPAMRRLIGGHGRSYVGITPTSVCCPARTSLLTGKYSHTTGIWSNVPTRHGGWPKFHRSGRERHTIATALHHKGYRTALIGKYLNSWNRTPQGYVPPGWDVFRGMWLADPHESGAYYDYWLKGTGASRWYGGAASDYSTDVTADRAVSFIRSTPAKKPLFLMWTPWATHLPARPAPRYVGSWSAQHPYRNKAVNEVRVRDKVGFIHHLHNVDLNYVDYMQDTTMETLRAVDDGVQRIVHALGRRIHNTLIIFASDSGYMWGEHRMATKYEPYRWATEYPLFVRWDGHIRHGNSHRLVPHVDLSATILQAARATGQFRIDGRSILGKGRSQVVLEGMAAGVESAGGSGLRPPFCGVRTQRYLYVKWSGDRKAELYDYRHDPLELSNVVGRSRYRDERRHLHHVAVGLCHPRAPGFRWN
jgi:arylsulfatase A-like enzyme